MTQATPNGHDVAKAARVTTTHVAGEIMVGNEIVDALEDAPGPRCVEEDTVELRGLRGEHRLRTVVAA